MATKRKVAVRYTTRACDFCKTRHLRCDGQEICFQCKKRNQACNYTQKNVKRGPKPKKKRPRKEGEEELDPSFVDEAAQQGFVWTRYDALRQTDFSPLTKDDMDPLRSGFEPLVRDGLPEPSYDLVFASLVAFVEKISPIHPNNFNLIPQEAFDSWKQVACNSQYTKLKEIVDSFMYCVVFGHGTRALGQEILSLTFSAKGEQIAHTLFLSPSSLNPEMYSCHADTLVSCATLLGVLKLESGDLNGARLSFIQAYNVLNMHVNDVTPLVAHRLYAHLAGMARSTADMGHWVSNAHALGPEAGTPINRVMLSLLYCCPSMLRDPKNKPLPPVLHIPQSHTHLKEKDHALYRQMLQELVDTENVVWESEPGKNHNYDPQQPLPPSLTPDHIISYKIVIEGCRAMVYAQYGYPDQALSSAEKCIRESKTLQARVSYWALPLTLAYSLQVAKTLNNLPLFHSGIPVLELYAGHFPFVHHMLATLVTKMSPAFDVMEVPMGMGLGVDMAAMGLGMVPGMTMVPGVGVVSGMGMIPGMGMAMGMVPGMGVISGLGMVGPGQVTTTSQEAAVALEHHNDISGSSVDIGTSVHHGDEVTVGSSLQELGTDPRVGQNSGVLTGSGTESGISLEMSMAMGLSSGGTLNGTVGMQMGPIPLLVPQGGGAVTSSPETLIQSGHEKKGPISNDEVSPDNKTEGHDSPTEGSHLSSELPQTVPVSFHQLLHRTIMYDSNNNPGVVPYFPTMDNNSVESPAYYRGLY